MNQYRTPPRLRRRNRRFEVSSLIYPALFAGLVLFTVTANSDIALSVDSEEVAPVVVFPAEQENVFDKSKFPKSDSYTDHQAKVLAATVVARQVGGGS